MNKVEIRPLPEMLGRKDVAMTQGQWVINKCEPVRGKPMTDIVSRRMHVPVGDEQLDRVIRAHEMMHARVSPADDFGKWIERNIATEQALRVVEEIRVNYLVNKAGFDTDILEDGTELVTGQRLAEQGDWTSLVYTAVGYAHCGGGKQFMTGVRRVNRAWGQTLRDIVKAVEKEIVKADKKGTLASTEIDRASGLHPMGFAHVERIGEWIDRLANPPVDDEPENEEGEGQQNPQQQQQNKAENENPKNGEGATNKKQDEKKAPVNPKEVLPAQANQGVPTWGELKVKRLPLTRSANGGLGRRRIASNMGRNPRRIGNALVDPEKRVFDRFKSGNGGVVLIDGSGSMNLTSKDLLDITQASPGCTVAVYSADSANLNDNLFILAENGKMVMEVPKRNGGNGVDAPAIRWAIKQKKRNSTPVVWITDGKVHGLSLRDGYTDLLAMDCIKEVLKHKVHMALNVNEGVKVLKDLGANRKPKRWFPRRWVATYQVLNGKELK